MTEFRIYPYLTLRGRLAAAFIAGILPLVVLVGIFFHVYVKRSILQAAENDLKRRSDALVSTINVAASISIKNYLRAVAENNVNIIERYYAEYQTGVIDRHSFFTAVEHLFNQQPIGKSGYIYCLDTQGTAVFHPRPRIRNRDLSQFRFIQEQLRKRTGYMEYEWKNPEDANPRPKAMYMAYVDSMGWIVSVTAYRDEFKRLINLSDIESQVSALRFGASGYAYITDREGILLIHPMKEKAKRLASIISLDDSQGDLFKSADHNLVHYTYEDPLSHAREKRLAYFQFIAPYGWWVGTSFKEAEVFSPFHSVRLVFIFFSLLLLAVVIGVATWFSAYANRHLRTLMDGFSRGAAGRFDTRLPSSAQDEFGRLATYFNIFMETFEHNHAHLTAEIDHRREIQEQAHQSEERIKSLVKNSPVLLWAIDHQGILTFSEGSLPVSFPHEVSIGKPVAPLFEEWQGLSDHIDRALDGLSGIHTVKKPDYAVEIHYNPLFDNDQNVIGAVGITLDVTARIEAERNLTATEKARATLAMAIKQAAETIIITDTAGAIEYVNPAFEKISGYSQTDVRGKSFRIWRSEKHDDAFYAEIFQTVRSGKVWSGRIINRRKDGTHLYEDTTISPLRDDDGKIVNYVVSKRDVTQEVLLEDQLQQAQRMRAIGTLAGGIAHDFNNILSAILGFTELCIAEAAPATRMAGRLQKVLEAGNRAKDLIAQILTFSRQETTEIHPVKVAVIVEEVGKFIRASIPSTIGLKMETVAKDCVVMADATRLHQVVMNLCANAAHAMRDAGGELAIGLETVDLDHDGIKAQIRGLAPGSYACITVSDTGYGMNRETVKKIFDPYFTTKPKGEGTGMGLAVVHGIVTKLGGVVTVYSEPGEGTSFHVYIPLAAAEEPKPQDTLEGAMAPGTERILVVEDEPALLEIMEELLTYLGYSVVLCNNGIDAIERLIESAGAFDLIITDHTMPGMTGIELDARLTTMGYGIPVILCSGFSASISQKLPKETNVRSILDKPIINRQLAETIRQVLGE